MALDKDSDVSEVDKINMSNIDQCSGVLKKLISLNSSEIVSEICTLSNNCNFSRSEIPYFINYSSCTYESQPSDEYTPYKKRLETYLVPFLFAIIFIVGVVGNGTLIAVFIRHRAMRNVPNTYILSLALADLLVIVTCVPFTSTVYTVESWPWGEPVCRLSETVKDVSIGVSVFTLTALSADRYFAIVDPLRKLHATGGSKRASRCTIASAVCIWVLAALCALPAAIGSYLREFPQFKTCYPYPEAWGPQYARTMVLLHFLVYYAAPLAIIGLFYALMARHLVLSARNAPGEAQGTQRQMRARRKVAITVLAFVLLFAICFLPYHLFMMWFYFCPSAEEDYNPFWHTLRIVGFCLSFLNSCVNPIALYCVSGTFRKHFNRYLFCGKGGALGGLARDTTGRGTDMSRTSRKQYSNVSTRRTNVTASFRRPTLSKEATITLLGNGRGHRPSDTGTEPFRISQSML